MNKIQRQDVVRVNLGSVAEVIGHEQANTRPCIIVQILEPYGLAVIVPLTTKKSNLFHFVPIPKGTAGLTEDSYALCHQIRTISTKRILNILGTLPDRDFNKVLTVLADFLEL